MDGEWSLFGLALFKPKKWIWGPVPMEIFQQELTWNAECRLAVESTAGWNPASKPSGGQRCLVCKNFLDIQFYRCGGNFQQLHHGCYAIKSSWVLLLVAWWRQPVCHLGLSLEMLGGRVNDQTDNKNCLHIYTKLQEGIYLFFIKLRSWKSASLVLLLNNATFHQKDQLKEFNPRMRKQFGMRNNLEQKIRKNLLQCH